MTNTLGTLQAIHALLVAADRCRGLNQEMLELVLHYCVAALLKGGENELYRLCARFDELSHEYFDLRPMYEIGNVTYIGRFGDAYYAH